VNNELERIRKDVVALAISQTDEMKLPKPSFRADGVQSEIQVHNITAEPTCKVGRDGEGKHYVQFHFSFSLALQAPWALASGFSVS
jgi:hypothetical protein